MDISRVKEFLSDDWTRVQEEMSTALKSDITLLDSINSGILSNSGKQLRPLLALLVARAYSGKPATEVTCKFAAASELMHNATLLHDDVADNSTQRRGRPTVMSILGPTAAVLIGDFWLVRSIDTVLSASDSSEVIRVFAKTLSDLAEGEMLQLEKASSCDTTEEDYLKIIYNKTASLFRASVISAAISVGASEQVKHSLARFAELIGLAFQIKDDIFDYCPDENVGKPLGVDILEQKITLPLLGALANVPEEEQKRVRDMVMTIHQRPELRDEIVDFVHRKGGIEYAYQRLAQYTDQALESIAFLAPSREKDYLESLARYVGQRKI